MTVGPDDLLRLPYDDSLTLAGVTYVCRSLDHCYGRQGRPSASHLRHVVADLAAELALRRWLDVQGAPYGLLDDAPFTQPGRVRLLLGGRPLRIQTTVISRREHIRLLRREPACLLEGEAFQAVTDDPFERAGESDLLAFVVLAALETRNWRELRSALAAGQPSHLLGLPPSPAWVRPPSHRSLGRLVLENLGPEAVDLEVAGRSPSQHFWTDHFKLGPDRAAELPVDLQRLLSLHAAFPPEGPLKVRSPEAGLSWRVSPGSWINLWIYGLEIFLAGWATVGEFRRQALPIPKAGGGSSQQPPARAALALPFRRLRPMHHLTARLRQG